MSGQFACRNMNRTGGYHMLELARSMVMRCRAVILPRFGGPDVLEICDDVEVPDLKADEVLVRSRAVSVNPLDTHYIVFTAKDEVEAVLKSIYNGTNGEELLSHQMLFYKLKKKGLTEKYANL